MDNLKSKSAGMAKPTRRQTTVRIGGKRVVVTTTAKGKTTVRDAAVPEWMLQAEAVRQLKAMPEYAATAESAKPGTFTFAADFNAGKRNATRAKATGVMAGEPDIRVYGYGARLLLIEYKNAEGELSVDKVVKGKKRVGQTTRHALLRALGYRVEVIKATTPEECAAASVALVRGWLAANVAANDNVPTADATEAGHTQAQRTPAQRRAG